MAKFLSGRQSSLNVGVTSYTENQTVFNVTGRIGIGTTIATSNLHVIGSAIITGIVTATAFGGNLVGIASTALSLDGTAAGNLSVGFARTAGIATNLSGGGAGYIPYQSATNTTTFLNPTSASIGQVILWDGSAPYWGNISAASGAFSGITVRDEGVLVGTANSITTLNFVSPNLSVTASSGGSGIATIRMSDSIVGTSLSITGVSTFTNGSVLIGSGTSTGTASQSLQVTGGAYISGSVGVATTNPTQPLDVVGNVRFRSGIFDSNNSSGSSNNVLTSNGSGGWSWQPVSAIGGANIAIDANDTTDATRFLVFTNISSGSTATQYVSTNSNSLAFNPSSGNLGIGSTIPTSKLSVEGNARFSGVVTATTFSGQVNAGIGTITTLNFTTATGSNIVGTALSVATGIATIRTLNATNIVGTALSVATGIATIGTLNATNIVGTALSVATGIATIRTLNATNIVGTALSVATGISTLGVTTVTNLTAQNINNSGFTTTASLRITGAVYDSTNSPGTSGQVLQSTVTGTQWTTASAGGSGKFDTSIDNVLYVQPTGTLDIVGVGETFTQITTLPGGTEKYIVHSIHVTNVSNGDAEITAGFIMNAKKVPASISVSAGSSGGAGIHTFTVGSGSSITVGMAVTGTGNIGETTGIGTTAGFQYNTYVTSVDGNKITLSKPMSGRIEGTAFFSPVSDVVSRLPIPVGSAVELLKQPMILNAFDSIVLQSTGAGSGVGSTSTAALSQTANSNIITAAVGAAITNFIESGMLVQGTGTNTGIQTNTFVGVGYIPGSLSIPITRPALTSLASTSFSFTEVVVPQDGALQATIVYQSTTDTTYQNGTGTVVGIATSASYATPGITSTAPVCYYGTGNTYPSTVQSIRVSNISDSSIYPGGDYPVWVGIGNSDTVFSWLAYNMIVPKNSSIELCEAPKRLGIGQSIFAYASTPNVLEIQIAAKQKV